MSDKKTKLTSPCGFDVWLNEVVFVDCHIIVYRMNVIKIFAGSFVLLLLTSYCTGQNLTVFGPITNDTQWDFDTVKVVGDLDIANGKILRVMAGTYVQVSAKVIINCRGAIQLLGTYDRPVVLSVADSVNAQPIPDEGWNGIKLLYDWDGGHSGVNNTNDSSIFNYCVIEYSRFGAVEVENFSKLRFSNSTFRKNYSNGTLNFSYSRAVITNCSFYDNSKSGSDGGAVDLWASSARITNSRFINNSAGDGGAINITSGPDVLLRNNIFSHNLASNGGAIKFHAFDGFIINCIFDNNTAIHGGGSVYGNMGSPRFINNTIVNNVSEYAPGILLSSSCSIFNTVFWNNIDADDYPAQIYLSGTSPRPYVQNCLIQNGDRYDQSLYEKFEFVQYADPMFVGSTTQLSYNASEIFDAWRVDSTSVAVDNGFNKFPSYDVVPLDITGKRRVSHGTVDIGAIEFQSGLATPTEPQPDPGEVTSIEIPLDELSIFPNPVKETLTIRSGENINRTVELFDQQGRRILDTTFEGETKLDLTNFTPGLYLIIFKGGSKYVTSRKVLKVK